jgi:hypothetical protein
MSLKKLLDNMPTYNEDGDRYMKIKEILNSLTTEKWLMLSQNEPELVFSLMQGHDFDNLYIENGWYKLYRYILLKHPEYIEKIPENEGYHRKEQSRLTEEQYKDLYEIGKFHMMEKELRKKQKGQLCDLVINEFMEKINS